MSAISEIVEALKIKSMIIVDGGPSVSDPMGLIHKSVGFRDKLGNGFWFAVNDDGIIIQFGATINGHEYRLPYIENIGVRHVTSIKMGDENNV